MEIADEAVTPIEEMLHPVFGYYDGHLLFEERLSEFFTDKEALKDAKTALDDFLKRAAGGRRPLPYYGLLAADGDHMGKVIDHQDTMKDHRDLSLTLSGFAKRAAEIVAEYEGSCVYAGGDDVLAFLPLHKALPCAQTLAKTFFDTMQRFHDKEGHSPTLSVGLAISHHLEPLSDALELARQAEAAAKRRPHKNALAVTLSKRSGVDRTVAGEWGTVDERLQWFIRLHRQDALPDGAAYELQDLSNRLRVADSHPDAARLKDAGRAEATRILERKQARRGSEEVDKTIRKDLAHRITSQQVTVGQLADEIVIARILADAEDLANLELVKEESHANVAH